MKQVLQSPKGGTPFIDEVPAPTCGPGLVKVRVRASAISAGTERSLFEFANASLLSKALKRPDLVRKVLAKARKDGALAAWEAVAGRLESNLPLGYSCAGVVEEVGEGVSSLRPGDRVACGGAGYANHAEVVLVPENLCVPLPADGSVAFEDAAFTTIAAIGINGLRLGEPRLGESVAVIGLGLVGQLAVQVAKAAGLRVLGIDVVESRVALAKGAGGADLAVQRERAESGALELSGGRGIDIVLITAGGPSSDAVELAGSIARERAIVSVVGDVGMTIPRRSYYAKELTLRVSKSYGPGRYDPIYEEAGIDYPISHVRWTERRNMEEAVRQMATGKLRPATLITHRFRIDEAPKAYEAVTRPDSGALGVVLQYPGQEEPTSRRVEVSVPASGAPGIGVLGAGAFARSVLLPKLKRTGLRLRGIATPMGRSAKAAASSFGFEYASSDASEILQDPETAAVAVLTRHNLHADQVEAVLRAGKHVFVEKPLCIEESDIERIDRARRASPDRMVLVGFNRRFAPYSVRLSRLLEGTSGPRAVLIRVNAGEVPADHWVLDPEIGGGRLLGEGCHFFDWANFIVGSTPVRVLCRPVGRTRGDSDWAASVSYADGSVAEIMYSSRGAADAGKERYEVHAGGLSAVLDDFRSLQVWGRHAAVWRSWTQRDKGHQAELEEFTRTIERGGEAPIPWHETLLSTRLTFAAARSLRSGGEERVG